MTMAVFVGSFTTIVLICLGFYKKRSLILSRLQMVWIWIIIALNNGGMDFAGNREIYEYSINETIRFPSGGWLSALLARLSGFYGLSYWQYNAILCTVVLIILFVVINKFTEQVSLYLSLFMIFPFAESVIQKRWFLMMVLAFVAFICVSENKYVYAILWFILALGFHGSALILMPIVLMDKLIEKSRWIFLSIFTFEIVLLTYGQKILTGIMGTYSGKFSYYYKEAHISLKASLFFISLNLFFIGTMLMIENGTSTVLGIRFTKKLDFVSKINIFSLIYVPLLLADAVFFRNYRIAMLFNFFVLSKTIGRIGVIKGNNELKAYIFFLAMIAYVTIGYSIDKAGLLGPIDTMFNHNQLLDLFR